MATRKPTLESLLGQLADLLELERDKARERLSIAVEEREKAESRHSDLCQLSKYVARLRPKDDGC